jgi:putative NADPH-quinone reductase
MKILLILCHPATSSFNGKIAETIRGAVEEAGHDFTSHDLYRESFDPILREEEYIRKYSLDEQVQRYMDEVTDSEVLVFVHPDWWGQPPALLKGWLDRVFRTGIAFDYEGEEFLQKRLEKLLTGKKGIAYCTTDSEEKNGPHPLVSLWEEAIFGYCGIEGRCRILYAVHASSAAERKAWIADIGKEIRSLLST